MRRLLVLWLVVPLVVRPADCQVAQQYDCMVGAAACENTGSVVYTGRSVACCRPGDSISSSVSAAFDTRSGVYTNHGCTCTPAGLVTINGRPMSPAEKHQFLQEMNEWSASFRHNMDTFFSNLSTRLATMFNGWIF